MIKNSSPAEANLFSSQPPLEMDVINKIEELNVLTVPQMKEAKNEAAVIRAIRHLMNPKGSSLVEIRKFLTTEHKLGAISDTKNIKSQLQAALKRGILSEAGGKYQLNEAAGRRSGRKRRSRSRRRGRSPSGGRRKSRSRRKRSTGRRRKASSGRRRKRSGSRKQRRSRRSGSRKQRRSRRTRRHKNHPGHVPGDENE